MGYTPPERVTTVDFAGTILDGLHVKIRDVDTDTVLEMVRLSSGLGRDGDDKGAGALDALITMTANMILEWDLEIPAGNPLPPTREVLGKRGIGFVTTLVNACVKASQDVPADLGKGSPSGQPSPAVLPMTAP